jgi:hypothetical protein
MSSFSVLLAGCNNRDRLLPAITWAARSIVEFVVQQTLAGTMSLRPADFANLGTRDVGHQFHGTAIDHLAGDIEDDHQADIRNPAMLL